MDSSQQSLQTEACKYSTLHDGCNKAACRIFLAYPSESADVNPIRRCCLCSTSLHHLCAGRGILTSCPSGAAFAIPLGPTNPWLITIAKETLIFRRGGISPPLRLLVPAFSLPYAPHWVAPYASLQTECSLTTSRTSQRTRRIIFGWSP